jgi:hypothetical protein
LNNLSTSPPKTFPRPSEDYFNGKKEPKEQRGSKRKCGDDDSSNRNQIKSYYASKRNEKRGNVESEECLTDGSTNELL